MDDLAYQVLDECYFLTNRSELAETTGLSEEELNKILINIWSSGFLRVYEEPDGREYEVNESIDWDNAWFVISKKGLQEHTSS